MDGGVEGFLCPVQKSMANVTEYNAYVIVISSMTYRNEVDGQKVCAHGHNTPIRLFRYNLAMYSLKVSALQFVHYFVGHAELIIRLYWI